MAAREWAAAWKSLARKYRGLQIHGNQRMANLEGFYSDDQERKRQLRAEIARLRESQPCGHPVQAIRSGRDKGDHTSNWCGWCADVARLREALHGLLDGLDANHDERLGLTSGQWERRIKEARRAALSTPVGESAPGFAFARATGATGNDWLTRHDEEVRREYLDSLCEPDILMTWVEYEIDSLKGWHAICRDYEGTDEIAVKYFGEANTAPGALKEAT